MSRYVAPENDTRALPAPPERADDVRVSVVIPVYNRVELLERVVAGLVVQDHPADRLQVVVSDDGSTEDVAGAMRPWQDRLDLTVVRREHEGYGAGQARNLGAQVADGDVVLFVDADCLPARSLVRRHAAWHTLADNLVVVGARHDLDTTDITAAAIADGAYVVDAGDGSAPSDWRALFYRRTARLQVGDEAYRAVISNNLSVRRDAFLAVGGFCEDFVRWGGEDTELGWRLSRAGCFVVAADEAVVHHQVQVDGEEGWREAQRSLNDGLVRTKIPHRFYRRVDPLVQHEVPKLSWVVLDADEEVAEQLLADLDRHRFRDAELVLQDPTGAMAAFADLHRADPRVRVVVDPDPLVVIGAAAGEVLLLLDRRARPDDNAAGRIVRRLDARPRTQVVTVGAVEGAGPGARTWAHPAEVVDLGAALGTPWPPLVAVRGREVAKVLPLVEDVAGLWAALGAICTAEHLATPLVAVPDRAAGATARRPRVTRVPSRRRVLADVVAGDAPVRSGAKAMVVGVRGRLERATADPAAPAAATATSTADDAAPVQVRYLGWTGHQNIGDEAMLAAARQLMPWADITTKGDPGRLLVLGGGTLINRFSYLRLLKERDSPRSERVVLGTGVAAPEFWGQTEPADDWSQYLATCGYVGVRGPDSLERLRAFGYDGPAEVSGDLALALEGPDDVAREDGLVVVSPVWTSGKLHGGDDRAVQEVLGDAVAALLAQGRQVHLMACHPNDDRWCFELMRRAGRADLPYTAGYDDLDATLRLLASADTVVAERLHAGVLAAVVGTPFVPVEYRPKARDFARSVEADDVLLRTDELSVAALVDAIARVDATRAERTERVSSHVASYRGRLRAAATTIEGLVR